MNAWQVITDPHTLRRLGKLQEELGELVGIVGRCQIQGFDGVDPKTGVKNLKAFEEEIADVWAQLQCCINELGLDKESITDRAAKKIVWMNKWEDAVHNRVVHERPTE